MSTTGTDHIVEEYLEQLNSALALVPATRRAEIVNEIAQHVADGRSALDEETEVAVRNLLDRVGSPEDIAAEALPATPQQPGAARRSFRGVAAVAIALAAVGIAVGALVATAGSGTTRPHPTASTGLFKQPPAATALTVVESGHAYGHPWIYSAQVEGTAQDRSFSANVFFKGVIGTAGEGGGGPWRSQPKFQMNVFSGGGTRFKARFLYGVTSLAAVRIEIKFVRRPSLVTDTVTNPAFPGLQFFTANLLDRGTILTIEALGASGTPIVRCPHNDGSEWNLCTYAS